jgi:hypothetical protein
MGNRMKEMSVMWITEMGDEVGRDRFDVDVDAICDRERSAEDGRE